MSVPDSVCGSPSHAIFLRGRTGVEPILLYLWSPSYYTRGAHLIKRVEPILLHAWSPSYYTHGALKTGGDAERPSPTRGAVPWTRERVDASTAHFFLFIFYLINHSTSQKFYRSYYPHRSRDSLSPVCGIFTNSAPLGRVGHRVAMSVCLWFCLCVCLSVPSRNTHFRRSCRPLVEDRVPNIGLG